MSEDPPPPLRLGPGGRLGRAAGRKDRAALRRARLFGPWIELVAVATSLVVVGVLAWFSQPERRMPDPQDGIDRRLDYGRAPFVREEPEPEDEPHHLLDPWPREKALEALAGVRELERLLREQALRFATLDREQAFATGVAGDDPLTRKIEAWAPWRDQFVARVEREASERGIDVLSAPAEPVELDAVFRVLARLPDEIVSGWRSPRTSAVPESRAELRDALEALERWVDELP